jgi:hypothetical protein
MFLQCTPSVADGRHTHWQQSQNLHSTEGHVWFATHMPSFVPDMLKPSAAGHFVQKPCTQQPLNAAASAQAASDRPGRVAVMGLPSSPATCIPKLLHEVTSRGHTQLRKLKRALSQLWKYGCVFGGGVDLNHSQHFAKVCC